MPSASFSSLVRQSDEHPLAELALNDEDECGGPVRILRRGALAPAGSVPLSGILSSERLA